jgi:hypothetical protein
VVADWTEQTKTKKVRATPSALPRSKTWRAQPSWWWRGPAAGVELPGTNCIHVQRTTPSTDLFDSSSQPVGTRIISCPPHCLVYLRSDTQATRARQCEPEFQKMAEFRWNGRIRSAPISKDIVRLFQKWGEIRRIKSFTSHLGNKSSSFLPNPARFENNRTRPKSARSHRLPPILPKKN